LDAQNIFIGSAGSKDTKHAFEMLWARFHILALSLGSSSDEDSGVMGDLFHNPVINFKNVHAVDNSE
jgi:hypothetical protein